ncbi:cytochrome P450 [Flagelloscypha sp. PMI_526]|nr:cytochrome P450 [Flagelloscypha sp. PMI_526]
MTAMSGLVWSAALPVLIAILVVSLVHRSSRTRRLLPPGPESRPLTGSLHVLPRKDPWVTYKEWSEKYGSPLISYKIFGRKFLILNNVQSIQDLLDGRASIYSDRYQPPFYTNLVGQGLSPISISSQHPWHKIYRRLFHNGLSPRAVSGYSDKLELERNHLLCILYQSPDEYERHISQSTAAFIMSITYGWNVEGPHDRFLQTFQELAVILNDCIRPGNWLVDYFPILRFIPSWFPGAGFKRKAATYREAFTKLGYEPFQWTQSQIESNVARPSFLSTLLTSEELYNESNREYIFQQVARGIYTGGLDTTASLLMYFILSMVQRPSIQRTAQAEIDEVVGTNRFPTFRDFDQLPYITAMLKEILRVYPVVRLGLPHRVTVDDTYNNMWIAEGTTIVSNIWGVMRDPAVYKDPDTFDPARHLGDKPELDPRRLVFGFGRRRCPGEHLAWPSLLLTVTGILSAFTIQPPVDSNGLEYSPAPEDRPGLISRPHHFPCRFAPRLSEKQKEMIFADQ